MREGYKSTVHSSLTPSISSSFVKVEKCLKVNNHQFLWWTWSTKDYEHDFAYLNDKERKCEKCGRGEIAIGSHYFEGVEYKDWVKRLR